MTPKLMGRKKGMMQTFDETGRIIPCTVIEVEPNVVVQVKTADKDGYDAIQLGFDKIQVKDERTLGRRISKPLAGHFKKAGIQPMKRLQEIRLSESSEMKTGEEIAVTALKDVSHVDVTGTSKGKGFSGAMKKHNFAGGRASHGASKDHRKLGSTGNRSTPGRCFPGGKRASQLGNETKTVQNLRVVEVNEDDRLLIVRGAVPGPVNGFITIQPAIKKQKVK